MVINLGTVDFAERDTVPHLDQGGCVVHIDGETLLERGRRFEVSPRARSLGFSDSRRVFHDEVWLHVVLDVTPLLERVENNRSHSMLDFERKRRRIETD